MLVLEKVFLVTVNTASPEAYGLAISVLGIYETEDQAKKVVNEAATTIMKDCEEVKDFMRGVINKRKREMSEIEILEYISESFFRITPVTLGKTAKITTMNPRSLNAFEINGPELGSYYE